MATKKITNRAAKATTEITPADLGIAAAKADAARNEEREAMKASMQPTTPAAKKVATKKAAKPAAKATKKTAKVAKGKKADGTKATSKAASTALAIHINKTGRVCFGKLAADRIGRATYMTITADGTKITMQPHEKKVEGAVQMPRANGRPYVSATKILKATGKFDGTKPLDVIATPYNSTGLEFKVT